MADNGERRKSFENINYVLRPAKNVERKMLCEAFSRLIVFTQTNRYRYIGFGSTFFSDFAMIHKMLGITKMISIEKEVSKRDRFMFNRPFRCIRVKFGASTQVLPSLSWMDKSIIWLDYDGRLDTDVLADVRTVCSRARPGSMLVVSVNANPDKPFKNGKPVDRVESLRRKLGATRVPLGITDADLRDWGNAKVCRRIINNEIMEVLAERNGATSGTGTILYNQLFNFHYADGAKMLTVGGILYNQRQSCRLRQSCVENLPFIRQGGEPYHIDVPNLTYRELRYLDSCLPILSKKPILPGVPDSDIENYAQIYRYYPTFAEAEI